MKRYRVMRQLSLGYGYHLPVEVVAYRFTRGAARRLTEMLNAAATHPMFFYERNDDGKVG